MNAQQSSFKKQDTSHLGNIWEIGRKNKFGVLRTLVGRLYKSEQ